MSGLKKIAKVAKQQSKITPKLTGWLANHDEGVVVADAEMQKTLLRLLAPGGTRAGAFHPSQLYQCERRQVFDYYDVPRLKEYNPQLQNIFNDGTWRHARWQIMLLQAGVLSSVEVGVAMEEYRLTGSMDGVSDFGEDVWMFELKGTSQFSTVKNHGALPAHIKQVHGYLLASGLDQAVVVYEDKSTQNWLEVEVHRDESTIDEIVGILASLNVAIEHDELPEVLDECKVRKGSTFTKCPYSHVCLSAVSAEDAIDWGQALSG